MPDCSPAALVFAARCFSCVPREMESAAELYLLAVAAGGSLDPATLVRQAKCDICVLREMRDAVEISLLCQIANA